MGYLPIAYSSLQRLYVIGILKSAVYVAYCRVITVCIIFLINIVAKC